MIIGPPETSQEYSSSFHNFTTPGPSKKGSEQERAFVRTDHPTGSVVRSSARLFLVNVDTLGLIPVKIT
jgi:hypothetical protein